MTFATWHGLARFVSTKRARGDAHTEGPHEQDQTSTSISARGWFEPARGSPRRRREKELRDIVSSARATDLSCAQARELDDDALHVRLHPAPVARSVRHLAPE